MATYDTDEEQIEALKRWWKENGTSLLIGIAVVVAGVFGWRQWQSSRAADADQASALYNQLVNIAGGNPAEELPEEDFSTAQYLGQQLRESHDDTVYARYAALFLAKLYVDEGELDNAEAQLRWVVDNPELGLFRESEPALALTARLRLARVLLAKGEARAALELLDAVDPGAFSGPYAEARGDAWLALGEQANAREAYQLAVAQGGGALVELKLRDLGAR